MSNDRSRVRHLFRAHRLAPKEQRCPWPALKTYREVITVYVVN